MPRGTVGAGAGPEPAVGPDLEAGLEFYVEAELEPAVGPEVVAGLEPDVAAGLAHAVESDVEAGREPDVAAVLVHHRSFGHVRLDRHVAPLRFLARRERRETVE